MPIGSKPIAVSAQEMGMPEEAYREVLRMGKVPVPFDSDDLVREANRRPSRHDFHVRDNADPDIWYRINRPKRMRLGRDFYENPIRESDFRGFDSKDKTAVYRNP